jgi:hypothetical protein
MSPAKYDSWSSPKGRTLHEQITRQRFESPQTSPNKQNRSQIELSSGPRLTTPQAGNISTAKTSFSSRLFEADRDVESATDTFSARIGDLIAEHNKLMEEVIAENEDLRNRLNQVLTSIWSCGRDAMHGMLRQPEQGELQLSCTGKSDYIVPEDDILKAQAEKETSFTLRAGWKSIVEFPKTVAYRVSSDGTTARNNNAASRSGKRRPSDSHETLEFLPSSRPQHRLPNIISSPASNHRLVWDLCGLFLLVYDLIMIPISLFSPPENLFIEFMEWSTLIFWTFDILASLTTGYISSEGITIMDPFLIFLNYLRGWFVLDLIVMGPDWIVASMQAIKGRDWGDGGASASQTNLAGLLRIARLVRVLRLLRVAKLKRILVRFKDSIESEVVFVIFRAVQLVFLMVFLNHLLGGLFYFLGDLSKRAGAPSWVLFDDLHMKELGYKYTTAIHWSLSNFALGTTNVEPVNTAERFFAISVLILGMVMYCILTAAFTNWCIQISQVNGESSRQLWLLRRYFRQKSVSTDLSYRILRYMDHKIEQERETRIEKNLTILSSLSQNLQNELKWIADFGSLRSHPLFEHAEGISSVIMHSLVQDVLSLVQYASEDIVFQRGALSSCMYMCVSGDVSYRRPKAFPDRTARSKDWFCEAALFITWVCRGDAQVMSTDAKIIHVDSRAFFESIKTDESMFAAMSGYGDVYVEGLNDMDPSMLSDLHVFDESSEKATNCLQDSIDRFARHADSGDS